MFSVSSVDTLFLRVPSCPSWIEISSFVGCCTWEPAGLRIDGMGRSTAGANLSNRIENAKIYLPDQPDTDPPARFPRTAIILVIRVYRKCSDDLGSLGIAIDLSRRLSIAVAISRITIPEHSLPCRFSRGNGIQRYGKKHRHEKTTMNPLRQQQSPRQQSPSGTLRAADVPLQEASRDIWNTKYRLRGKDGRVLDKDVDDTWRRVARALADVEEGPEKRREWYEKFLFALRTGAIPAGRIVSNAGALAHKPATSTINCTVSGIVYDSMDDILAKVHEAGLTLKAGCGIGYEFSTLRPKGAFVAGAGAHTSGPLSFMDIYDKMCFTVSSAGGRRGAQMATFDIGHPDVMNFIRVKREDGRLRQFNLSLLISHGFMEAVFDDRQWRLAFPVTEAEIRTEDLDPDDPGQIIWRAWPVTGDYRQDSEGNIACKVYKTLRARRVWDAIMTSTYDFAEPGFILVDEINEMNNNWFCEDIRATNPCGEQPLPAYGSCLLGSINLTRFVLDPFTERARFDWELFRETVGIFTRMLDNVVEINGLPLARQREEIEQKRRHGMGYLGLGSTLTMLRLRYGSEAAIEFTERVTREMAVEGWRVGLALGKEKGAAPMLEEEYPITERMLRLRPEMKEDGIAVGDKIKGKVLHARYSRYLQRLAEIEPQLVADLAESGSRFTHHTSIAPTGTIALSLANNASNGIEPSFAHQYSRNIIREGRKTKEKLDVYSFELLAFREYINPGASPFADNPRDRLPEYFITAQDISPREHVDMQAAAQRWIDSSISKTINVPSGCPYGDFKDIYRYAYEKGLKGCTTFRFNPEAFQGVLVTERDLENTVYSFTLEDGSTIELKGNETVEYDGDTHTAANLYDALKEGYYGKL
ncbi:MAG: ribonucleoside-diphosphate reductase class II [Candidatus Kentron sp. G]|nr:MAG: ribonucleoside-diphosphate reductase class II [Candidatus Kentron sp. G]VFM98090.1 MAG: ribonucleoside-diphosphate reductase class II [Candidatus Kentron sp. G]